MRKVKIENGQFVDDSKNKIFFHGVNFADNKQEPNSYKGAKKKQNNLRDHFSRIKKWGFNLIRLPVTWEAIEPEPGEYSPDYVRYVEHIIEEAGKEGIMVQIAFLQSGWSRFSGIAGAPEWALTKLGIDTNVLKTLRQKGDEYFAEYFVEMTMFTVFFGGSVFFPRLLIDGKSAEEYLQDHFIKSVHRLIAKVEKFDNLIGLDFMEGYSPGFIGIPRLDEYDSSPWEQRRRVNSLGKSSYKDFGLLATPTPFQLLFQSEGQSVMANISIMLGSHGFTVWKKVLNQGKNNIWQNGHRSIFREHRIWDYDPNGAPVLLQPDYFSGRNGKKINFRSDFLIPFMTKLRRAIDRKSRLLIFYEEYSINDKKELPGFQGHSFIPSLKFKDLILENTRIFYRSFIISPIDKMFVVGERKIKQALINSLKKQKKHFTFKTGSPLFISETGIRFDLKKCKSINELKSAWRDALDRILTSAEANFISYVIYNYNPSGDEDNTSIFLPSLVGITDEEGGRGTEGFSRPYVVKLKGIPVSTSFNPVKRLFKLSFKQEKEISACEIFIPKIHYPNGIDVMLNAGSYNFDSKKNILIFRGEKGTSLYGISISELKK